MTAHQIPNSVDPHHLSRRGFLARSCLAASVGGTGLWAGRLPGGQAAKSSEVPEIDPGYVGPQFFDEREQVDWGGNIRQFRKRFSWDNMVETIESF